MKILKLISLVVISVTVYLKCSAQDIDYKFEYITLKDGLSHNNVYSIIQDHKGFIWFGTGNGLDKYDGVKIKSYRHDPTNENSLSSSNFGKILQDKDGIFWFGTYGGGLDMYDPYTKKFKHFVHSNENVNSISNNRIQFIFEDSYGIIWIGTAGGGLNAFLKSNEQFIRYQHDPNDSNSVSSDFVKPICEDLNGNIWVGTRNGLDYFERSSNQFKHFINDKNDKNSLSDNNIRTLMIDSSNVLWIGTRGGGLNVFNPKTKKFKHFKFDKSNPNSIGDNRIEYIYRDSYQNIWIGTYSAGLDQYSPKTGKFTRIEDKVLPGEGLSNNRIEYIIEDKSHILWIATRGGGVNKLNLKPRKFRNINYDRYKPNMLPHPSVWAIEKDKSGNLWIGTDGGGIARYNPITEKFIQYFRHSYTNVNSLKENRVWSIYPQSNDSIWIGTYENGLDLLIIKDDKPIFHLFKNNPLLPGSISDNQINDIFNDSYGDIWVGTQNGINKIVVENNEIHFKPYKHNKQQEKSLSDNYVSIIYEDSHRDLWVGTYIGGLNKYDRENDVFSPIKLDNLPSDFDLYRVQAIFEDHLDRFWIGTEGGGFYLLDRETNKLERFLLEDASHSNVIMAIQEDNSGNLWLSTTDGMLKFNYENRHFTSYDITDGLKTHGYNRNASFKDKKGVMYFGSIDGITVFNPEKVVDNTNIPPVVITDFKIFNNSIYSNYKGSTPIIDVMEDIVKLSHKDYVFSIEFASLDYTFPMQNHYKYILEGFNDSWIDIDNHRYVTFTKLDPGTYIFNVIGSNDDEIWNEEGKKLTIIIQPPLWRTKWFIAIEVIILIIVFILIFYLRERKLISDKKRLEQHVIMRTHEISLQKEEIQSQAENLARINEELEEYSAIVRETDNAVSIMDSKGDYKWINEGFTRLYGYTLEELLKERGRRRIGSNSNLKLTDLINIWFGDKKTIIYESQNLTKDGNKIWAQTTLTPVLDENKKVQSIIAIDSDISELKKAEEIIVNKNQDITDSLEYAKRIQQAILPPLNEIDCFCKEYFLFYKPKEIISGDFYWATSINDSNIIAIADCTGHGVPGAFMSMLGISLLNKIVKERMIMEPANILNRLRIDVINSLRQTGQEHEAKDGMDISIIKIFDKGKKIIFAGAMNSGMLIRNNEIIELEADKMPIGIHQNAKLPFRQIEYNIEEDDLIYLLTDGYVDQFGGTKSKKFKSSRLKELLLEIQYKDLDFQKKRIIERFMEWKGKEEQVDDILFLGIRF